MRELYETLSSLGQGSFGTVYKAKRKSNNSSADGLICVMKIIPIAQLDPTSQQDSLNEVAILSSLDNYYIVKYFDSFIEDNKLHIIMEYCEKGDISALIKSRTQPLKENRIWEIFLQSCLGLEYLHSRKILHRDIKTLNIFMFDDKNIRIGDLGVARVLSSTATFAHTVIGTPYYLSPELCEEKPYNVKSDVWALGCVLHELCTLKRPFDASNPGALILKILRSSYPPLNSTFSAEIREIVKLCLLKDQKKRPDVQTILRRPGMKERVLALNIFVPESSVLHTAKIMVNKTVEDFEEEKSVSRKKQARPQEMKKTVPKPRVRKGAPMNARKPNSYAKQMVNKVQKPQNKTGLHSEDEVKMVQNLPNMKPVVLSVVEDDEICANDDQSFDIITSEPPPMIQLTVNTVKNPQILNDSSSDDESYHSDDKELFQIREVDEKLEHSNAALRFKLQEIERNKAEFERIIEQRRAEIMGMIGNECFQELYAYFRMKYSVRNK
jgi:serine/threonine protein kinase